MFLDDVSFVVIGLISIPFILIIVFVSLIAIVYLMYLTIQMFQYKSKLGIKNLSRLFVGETIEIPDYEPAIMGYLVNYQKIGRREICSTLLDLIGRNVIKITLKKGFVSDDNGDYILQKENKDKKLTNYEINLIAYLFEDKEVIEAQTLHEKLYKGSLDEKFFSSFLKNIQEDAKQRNFFSAKTAKRKVRVYKIINKIVTVIASITSFICTLGFEILDSEFDFEESFLLFIIFLITAAILWILKFLISFMFNLTCYYNDFSIQGNEDYKKWLGFKKYLKICSTITDHPLMGVMVWERYYAYAIGLKCSKKFFKQMKKMKVVDNSIDIVLFETFNEIIECIGISAKKIKSISLDKYGGSHVDY